MAKFRRINHFIIVIVISLVSFSWTFAAEENKKTVRVLVISSRNYASMQPQIYYAFKDAARKVDPSLALKFVMFNPFFCRIIRRGTAI